MGQTLGDHPCDRDRVRRERGQHFRPSRCKRLTTRVCTTPNDEAQCVAEAANLLKTIGISLGLVSSQSRERHIELAAEGSWPIDLGGCGDPRCALLVSGLGQDRNTTQYRPTTVSGLVADRACRALGTATSAIPRQQIGVEIGQKTPFSHPKTGNAVSVRLANRVRRHGRCTSPRHAWSVVQNSARVGNFRPTGGHGPPKRRIGRKLDCTDSASMCFYCIR
jgi:hypothetical protein